MSLLSGAVSSGNKISVIVLCVAIIVFLLVDVILVVSLHKSNKRLVRRKQLSDAAQNENKEIKENTQE